MGNKRLYLVLLAVVAIICLLFLTPRGKDGEATYQHNEGTIFGTLYHVKYLCNKDL